MNGIRKAAIFLMSVGEKEAAVILAQMAPSQLEAVTQEMTKLQQIPKEELDTIVQEFIAQTRGG